ncbi:13041_t:CDS:2, partial [Funneliformis caledonium]
MTDEKEGISDFKKTSSLEELEAKLDSIANNDFTFEVSNANKIFTFEAKLDSNANITLEEPVSSVSNASKIFTIE